MAAHLKWRVKIDTVNNHGRHCVVAKEIQFYGARGGPGLVPPQTGYSAALLYSNDGYDAAWHAFDQTNAIWHNDCGTENAYIGWTFDAPVDVVGFSYNSRTGGYGDQDSMETGGLEYYDDDAAAWVRLFSIPAQDGWSNDEFRSFYSPASGVPDAGGHRYWEVCGTAGGGGYSGLSGCQMSYLDGVDLTDPNYIGSQQGGSFQAGSIRDILSNDNGIAQWNGGWDGTKWFAADFGENNGKAIRKIKIFPNRDDVNRTFTEFDVAVWDNPDRSDRTVVEHFVCAPWVVGVGQTFDIAAEVPPVFPDRRRQAVIVN